MKEQSEHTLILVGIVAILMLFAASWLFGTQPLTVNALISAPELPGDWQRCIHFSHNAYHSWRVESLPEWLLPGSLLPVPVIPIFVFTIGMILALINISKLSVILSTAFATLCAGVLIHLFAFDVVVLGTLSWVPLALALLNACSRGSSISRSLPLLALSVFVGFRIGYSANQFSLWIALLCCWISAPQKLSYTFTVCCLALCLPCLYPTFLAPVASFADYPAKALLVPDDGLPGNLNPLVISGYPIPVIYRKMVKSLMGAASIVGFALTLLTFLLMKKTEDRKLALATALLALLCALDTTLTESLASIMPLSTAARVLPGLTLFPLTPIVLSITVVLLFLLMGKELKLRLLLIVCGFLIAAMSPALYAMKSPGVLQSERRVRSLLLANTARQSSNPLLLDLLVSPSHFVLQREGTFSVQKTAAPREFVSARRFIEGVATSHRSDPRRTGRMIDGKPKSRWFAREGSMDGSEWVYLKFAGRFDLDGVELSPGKFRTDFPGGVRVSVPARCEPAEQFTSWVQENRMHRTVLSEQTPWHGPVYLTRAGFPYFGWQGTVQITFATRSAGCLLVEQLGQRRYQWSIAEVRLSGPDFTRLQPSSAVPAEKLDQPVLAPSE